MEIEITGSGNRIVMPRPGFLCRSSFDQVFLRPGLPSTRSSMEFSREREQSIMKGVVHLRRSHTCTHVLYDYEVSLYSCTIWLLDIHVPLYYMIIRYPCTPLYDILVFSYPEIINQGWRRTEDILEFSNKGIVLQLLSVRLSDIIFYKRQRV